MRIGLLVLSIGNFGKKGFYNLQEVGLARELDLLFDEVLVYRLVGQNEKETTESIAGCKNAVMHLLPSRQTGSNGLPDLNKLDASVDTLVCFSDTQIFFPSVYKWCKKNDIMLIPYIGVSKSHSDNPLKQILIDMLFVRNLSIYKKVTCLAKTPDVRNHLLKNGVQHVLVAPVGLDMGRLNPDYESASCEELKKKYGFDVNQKIVLFIGRMTKEKQPDRMLEIFETVHQNDSSFRLLMVGSGELDGYVEELINKKALGHTVKKMESIPNKEIWELYRIADCFVNLNQQEIYGMVLLEAMYYGCKVIAWHAPGPDYIITDGQTGYLTDSNEKTCELILDSCSLAAQSKSAILSDFTWKKTANIIHQLIAQKQAH